MSDPSVAVVVPVHDGFEQTRRFLDSFRNVDYFHRTIIVVDDGSTDGTSAFLRRDFPDVVVLAGNGNLWWAGATNKGVRFALQRRFDFVLTINNDTTVQPDFLRRLVETATANPRTIVGSCIRFMKHPDRVWAVGSRMIWQRGDVFSLQEQGRTDSPATGLVDVATLTGCGTLIPTSCFRRLGLYDQSNCPQYHADAEFVLRARKHGWHALVDRRAVVFNDTDHTVAGSTIRLADRLFSKRSAIYWRPVLAVHWRYCPWIYLPASLLQYYGWYFWNRDPNLRRRLGWLLRPLAARLRRNLDAPSPSADQSNASPIQAA